MEALVVIAPRQIYRKQSEYPHPRQCRMMMTMLMLMLMLMMMMMPRVRRPRGLDISGDRRKLRLHVVVSGEQITMRSTWVSSRGESLPQTKVTLKQLFEPPSIGGVQGVRRVSGRRLGP